jgi:protein-tyrosine phosphatase
MIDVHSHILHGIDDGPTEIEESLEMARIAVADGTKTIVATPHAPGPRTYTANLLRRRLAELREALQREAIPLEVLPGNELFYNANLVEMLHTGAFLTYNNTRTVLIETFISEPFPRDFRQAVYDLQIAGYRVVLAHPERISDVQDDPNILIPLIERGVLMQLTAQALTGEQGKHMQSLAEKLVKHHLVHLIASDAHGVSYRPPQLSEAYEHTVSLAGEKTAQAMVRDVPAALINGERLDVPEPQRVADHHKRWFWW